MWKFSLAQRIRTGAALVVVFLLVVATNRMDSSHFAIVKKNLRSVYDDRLVAKNYLYKMSRLLQEKKNIIYSQDIEKIREVNRSANDSINTLVGLFSETRLTQKEARHFESLQNNLNSLYQQEQLMQDGELVIEAEAQLLETTGSQYENLFTDLDVLSEIQLEEGNRKIQLSERAIGTSDLMSWLEIGILIVIGIILQLIIFLKPMK